MFPNPFSAGTFTTCIKPIFNGNFELHISNTAYAPWDRIEASVSHEIDTACFLIYWHVDDGLDVSEVSANVRISLNIYCVDDWEEQQERLRMELARVTTEVVVFRFPRRCGGKPYGIEAGPQ